MQIWSWTSKCSTHHHVQTQRQQCMTNLLSRRKIRSTWCKELQDMCHEVGQQSFPRPHFQEVEICRYGDNACCTAVWVSQSNFSMSLLPSLSRLTSFLRSNSDLYLQRLTCKAVCVTRACPTPEVLVEWSDENAWRKAMRMLHIKLSTPSPSSGCRYMPNSYYQNIIGGSLQVMLEARHIRSTLTMLDLSTWWAQPSQSQVSLLS